MDFTNMFPLLQAFFSLEILTFYLPSGSQTYPSLQEGISTLINAYIRSKLLSKSALLC